MRPSNPPNNSTNQFSTDAIFVGQFLLSRGAISKTDADILNIFRRQFCVIASDPIRYQSFRPSIVNVVLVCSKEQVRRVDARRVVAVVEHPQSVRNRAIVEFPREATSDPASGMAWSKPPFRCHALGGSNRAGAPLYFTTGSIGGIMEIKRGADTYLLTPTPDEWAAMEESDVWALGLNQWLESQAKERQQRALSQLDLLTEADRKDLLATLKERAAAKVEVDFGGAVKAG